MSSIPARVMRARYAAVPNPRVMAGNIQSNGPPQPATLRNGTCVATNLASMGPTTKVGMLMPSMARNIVPLSIRELCFRAAIIPAGIPIMTAMNIPVMPMITDTGKD